MRTGSDRVSSALRWVTSTLDHAEVPYQVVGGLAAIAHGANRPLNDVDLYAPLTGNDGLLGDLGPYTQWGPEHYRDEAWDVVFMKNDYDGIRIEIGDSSSHPRYYDAGRGLWVEQVIDFGSSDRLEVFGVSVNVIPLAELILYKERLAREVDRDDLRQLKNLTEGGGQGIVR